MCIRHVHPCLLGLKAQHGGHQMTQSAGIASLTSKGLTDDARLGRARATTVGVNLSHFGKRVA